jgi:hypothetical protein
MLQFSLTGTLALVALAMCWSLAIVVYRVSPAGSVGRQLSLLLVVEGATLISTGYIDLFLAEAARNASWYPVFYRFEEIVHTIGDCLMLALYPPFLAAALRTRLTEPFGTRRARIVLLLLAAILCVIVLWGSLKIGGTILYISLVLLFVFALVASLDAWRSAEGVTKSRAGTFAVAFGVRDVCWSFVYGWATLVLWQGTYAIVDPSAPTVPFLVYALGTLLAVPLIAYGILKTHLFDIDLKIQWTIRQSTVAAAFIAVFYLVTEGADRMFEAELGTWVGLLASALLIFFLAPLQRMAERVSQAVMPNTTDTPEYAAYKKLQVYEAALADALPGGISGKERALLNHLRDSLGIAAADADALERDLSE